MNTITMWTKGVCIPINPGGTIGVGYTVRDLGSTIVSASERIEADTNNTNIAAEYIALVHGMKWLLENNLSRHHILAYGDTEFVIEQMNGMWQRLGDGKYVPHFKEAWELKKEFKNFNLIWTPGKWNTEAKDLSMLKLADIPPPVFRRFPRKNYNLP